MKANEKFTALNCKNTDPRTRRYLYPKRIVYTQGEVSGEENLLLERSNQITFSSVGLCRLVNKKGAPHAAVLIDFGIEFPGSLRILARDVIPKNGRADLRVRLGESVSEAMTPINIKNTTNDHANRDQVINIGRYSANETNESGYRFAYVELLGDDCEVSFKSLQGVCSYRDVDYIGSFECSDERLGKIWDVAAYTVHMCMQEHLWDGIKRDRLVWIGDIHPEVKTILSVFGNQSVIADSLDLMRDDTPDNEWMNKIAPYSMWWVIIHHELFVATGDIEYLEEQRKYLRSLMTKIAGFVGEDGAERIPERRLLDWPNEANEQGKHAGLHGLLKITLDAGAALLRALGEDETAKLCEEQAEKMYAYVPDCNGSKQAAALLVLSGIADAKKINDELISVGGAHGYSTFFGYYLLKAKALAGDYDGALDDIKSYWGAMLDMGATTFWEDFDLDWTIGAARIDEIVGEGKKDIHGDYGAYCYENFRHSLCHGWSSGPCAYLTNYVLGIRAISADTYEIKPELSYLDWAKGCYPTPYGVIEVSAKRDGDKTIVDIKAPKEIKIIR